MNVAKAVELSIADVIRKNAKIGADVTIRPWQNLQADNSWEESLDRAFPMIDVRCSPPSTDDNQVTRSVECAILMATNADDDRSHADISTIYDTIDGLINQLFAQFRSEDWTQEPLATFISTVEDAAGATNFRLGGFTLSDGLGPYDDDGINMIGTSLITHYSTDAL